MQRFELTTLYRLFVTNYCIYDKNYYYLGAFNIHNIFLYLFKKNHETIYGHARLPP